MKFMPPAGTLSGGIGNSGMIEKTPAREDLSGVGETILPLVEERLQVSTREVETGRVRVSTVSLAHEERVRAELLHVDIEVERVPIGRVIEAAPLRLNKLWGIL